MRLDVGAWSAEVQIRTSEGLERWLRCNHSLLYEGGEWTTDVVIVHDVTRIRQAERAKTDFVATVSHELRTPITPIKGYVEILQARGPNLSEDKRQDMLRIVAERADHLARLVEDLLLASRISSDPGGSARAPEVVETFGALELEYAAVRKGCALFDLPQRGTTPRTRN